MFKEWTKEIREELSGRQAYRYADRIAQYHRIQASPGYREAANEVIRMLKRDGVHAELVSYPATFGERFLSHKSFKEWKCSLAELWIEGPKRKRLARFSEEEISVIQRSVSTPKEGIVAELVVIDHAEEESSYKGLDLKGKIALVNGNVQIVHALAVEKYGAAGLIFDNLNDYYPIRTRMDLPDARQYTSYWWHHEDEVKSFGFVVSPRISQELKQLAQHGIVQLRALVEAELVDGSFENIEYFIPGKNENEILIVSHLCHPYPGGQDNSSGPGTLMEVMRTLTRLIQEGGLREPELGIRFLLMPEMTGTAAYFEQHPDRIKQTVAALNLDMVGADQSKGGGPLCIEQPSIATPTFVDQFVFKLVEDLSTNTSNFSRTTSYSTVHYVKTRFSGGSDHYIISDPTVGIPCPMLIQWPDKHYHTTADTTNHLSEEMMKLVGICTALYAYGLAEGSESDWISYLLWHTGRVSGEINKAKEWITKQDFSAEERSQAMSLFTNYEALSLNQLQKYGELRRFSELVSLVQWAKNIVEKENKLAKEMLEKENSLMPEVNISSLKSDGWENKIYSRRFKGPLRLVDEIKSLPLEERLSWLIDSESRVPMGYSDYLFYWMDGEKSAEQLLHLVKLESGMYYPLYAKELFTLCLRLNLISINSSC